MNEEQLKLYWNAYTDAWKLMKNWKQVTDKHIAEMISKHNIGIMNRLFCLVVRQEIKRIKETGNPLPEKEYQKAFTEVWKLFKRYSTPCEDDAFWNGLTDEICKLGKEFGESQFVKNLLIYVTLEEIERIYKEKK